MRKYLLIFFLHDSTPAIETIVEFKRLGFTNYKALCISVLRNNKVIHMIISILTNYYNEDLKKIAYSLEFK